MAFILHKQFSVCVFWRLNITLKTDIYQYVIQTFRILSFYEQNLHNNFVDIFQLLSNHFQSSIIMNDFSFKS